MAATTDTEQAPSVALSRMYDTGSWSDLKIVTSTKTFRVHKSVVFSANAKLCRAAYRRPSKDSVDTGAAVDLKEREVVVDAMLRHFYELPIVWLHSLPSGAVLSDRLLSRGMDCAHLLVAAEKYDIKRLSVSALRMFQLCMSSYFTKTEHMIDLDCLFMDLAKDRVSLDLYNEGRDIVANATHQKLAGLVVDAFAWKKLYANEAYTRVVMSKAESMGREATKKRPAPEEA